jgi:ElaB/YqjD/DUF883 family membrane-anchored ribosome-binding protein
MESRIQNPSATDQSHATQKLLNELKVMIQRLEQRALERAKAADRVVRDHPYPTIGLALGLGLLVGFLLRRK